MRRVFRKIGFTVLILAVVLGITGGVAAAASPSESSILGAIKSIVTDIQAKVNNITSLQIPGIFGNMATMQGWITNIHDEIHTLLDEKQSSWGYSGNFTIYPGCDTYTYVSPSPYEPEGPKHVVMTIDLSEIVPPKAQGIVVLATIGDNANPVAVFACTGFWQYPESKFVTLDFIANDWEIQAADCDVDAVTIYYSVIVTPADLLGA